MSSKSSSVILITVLLSAIVGGLFGYYLPHLMLSLSFIGQLWLNALNILVIPLVAASIIVAVAAIGHMKKVSRSVRNMIVYFASTSAIAVVIGLLAVLIIRPGVVTQTNGAFIPETITEIGKLSTPGVIGSILPDNFFLATAQGQLLGLIVFSLLFGIVLAGMDDKTSKPVMSFVIGFNEVITRLVNYAVYIAPVGIFFLVGRAVAADGDSIANVLGSLGAFSFTLAVAFLLHGLVILPVTAKIFGRKSPFTYLGKVLPAITTAFATGSSVAALPVTYENVVEDCEVDRRASALTLPAGAMLNANGTALYLAIATVFIAQVFDIPISPFQILLIGAMAWLVSFATSLIPGASWIMLAVIINAAGFSANALAGIGLIIVVDWFWQRWRASLDVWGDAVGAAVIAETFEFKTARSTPPNPPMRRVFGKPFGRDERSDDRKPDRKRERPQRPTSRRSPERQTPPTAAAAPPATTEERPTRRERPTRPRRTRPDSGGRPDRRPRHESNRKEERVQPQEEKPFKYTLPPVPFHVLEGELAARKQPPKPQPEEKPIAEKEPSTAPRPDALSQESLERERASIAAQLASMRDRDPQMERDHEPNESSGKSPEDQTEHTDVKPSESDDSNENQRRERPRRDSGYDRRERGRRQRPEPEEKHEERSEEPKETSEAPRETSDSDQSQDSDVSYGRGRSRRGQQFKKEQHETPDSESEPKSPDNDEHREPEYSTEKASFGRGKRKK